MYIDYHVILPPIHLSSAAMWAFVAFLTSNIGFFFPNFSKMSKFLFFSAAKLPATGSNYKTQEQYRTIGCGSIRLTLSLLDPNTCKYEPLEKCQLKWTQFTIENISDWLTFLFLVLLAVGSLGYKYMHT